MNTDGSFLKFRCLRYVTAVFLVCLVSGVIYSNTFQVPFVFDDQYSVQENEKIRYLGNFYVPDVLLSPRPVVDYTFALNYHFGKLQVFGYHFVNLLIHIANGILVFFLALALFRKLTRADDESAYLAALFASLVFIAHPIQTQAVTYIAQRYSSMAAFFYLASVFSYLVARDTNTATRLLVRYGLLLISFLCGVFAFLSKQNSASLPLSILLIEYSCFDQTWNGWKKKLRIILPVGLLCGCVYAYNMGLFRHEIQFTRLLEDVSEITQETQGVGRWRYLCTQFNVISVYIRLVLLPIHQSLDYSYPFKAGFFDGATPYAFVFIAGIFLAGWWCRKKIPIVFFGIMWFFITLSVESSIFPIRDAMFEHRLYLPMFGFSVIAAHACERMCSKRRLCTYVLTMGVVLSLSVAAYSRNEVWRNDVMLWSDVVSKNPKNFRGFNNLGHAWMQRGDLKEAMANFDIAIRLRPDYCLSLSNKGVLMERMGKIDDAIFLFRKALDHRPDFFPAQKNLSSALKEKADLQSASGKYQESIELYKEALRIVPDSMEGHTNLGATYFRIGKKEEAINQFREALKIDPASFEAHANLGYALYSTGEIAEALQYLGRALKLKPDSEEIKNFIHKIIENKRAEPDKRPE
jgi:protein O-mannosyl-transferase